MGDTRARPWTLTHAGQNTRIDNEPSAVRGVKLTMRKSALTNKSLPRRSAESLCCVLLLARRFICSLSWSCLCVFWGIALSTAQQRGDTPRCPLVKSSEGFVHPMLVSEEKLLGNLSLVRNPSESGNERILAECFFCSTLISLTLRIHVNCPRNWTRVSRPVCLRSRGTESHPKTERWTLAAEPETLPFEFLDLKETFTGSQTDPTERSDFTHIEIRVVKCSCDALLIYFHGSRWN